MCVAWPSLGAVSFDRTTAWWCGAGGGHTIIEDDGSAKDTTHYTAAQLRQVRWSKTGFITQEISWNEQRMQLDAIRAALGADSALGRKIDAEMALIAGPKAMGALVQEGSGWKTVPPAQWAQPFTLGGAKLTLNATTGAIISLQQGGSVKATAGRNWASESHPIGRFAYVTHDDDQAEKFFANYSFGCPRCGWAKEAFSKPGVTPALANASVSYGTVRQMWRKDAGAAVAYELALPQDLTEEYGAPSSVFVELTAADSGLNLTLRWTNKTTTRLPESLWLEVRPAVDSEAELRVSKMGSSLIDPNDVVANGSSLHAADTEHGVSFATSAERLRVLSWDAPLVATGTAGQELNLWHSPTQHENATASQGTAFNLFNNLWNTNCAGDAFSICCACRLANIASITVVADVYWYPWRNGTATEDDGTTTFRWSLRFEPSSQHHAPASQQRTDARSAW